MMLVPARNAGERNEYETMEIREGIGAEVDDRALPGRLLVVEDDPLLAASLERHFARLGYVVRAALNCEEAEAATRVETYDCGVFDIHLGSGDGISLAVRLLGASRVRVAVFYSGAADAVSRRRAAEIGTLVQKESHIGELTRVVAELVERGPSDATLGLRISTELGRDGGGH